MKKLLGGSWRHGLVLIIVSLWICACQSGGTPGTGSTGTGGNGAQAGNAGKAGNIGNGGNAGVPDALYFTAGLNHEADGLFGSIVPAAKKKEHKDKD